VVEHITQSAYLNVQYDLRTLIPGTTLFYGACLERLGEPSSIPHEPFCQWYSKISLLAGLATLAKRRYESINSVYKDLCPLAESIRSICRLAYGLAHEGRYQASLQLLRSAMKHGRGILKIEQRVTGFIALIYLIKSLHRCVRELRICSCSMSRFPAESLADLYHHSNDLRASDYYFSSLKPLRGLADPELEFEINLREIDLLIHRQDLEQALVTVNAHITHLKNDPGAGP